MNKLKSQDKQIWFFLVHFEEAYLNHVQSMPRSQTHAKINKLLPVKRLQNHNNGEISSHIFAKQSISLMWGGVGGVVHFRSWSFQERRPPKVRPPDCGPASLLPVPTLEAPNCQQGPPGLPSSQLLPLALSPRQHDAGENGPRAVDLTKTPAHSPLRSYLAVLPCTQEPRGYQLPNHRGWRAGLSKGAAGSKKLEGSQAKASQPPPPV